MLDGELAWRLARKYAIIVFDDYHLDRGPEDSIHHPKRGIDAFLLLHQGDVTTSALVRTNIKLWFEN